MEYYLAIKKNEILPVITMRMDLEGNMFSEMLEEKKTICFHWYVESKE